MCWSAEVSTVFSILDVAAIGVLCFRDQKRDRYYALAAAPIAGQELCQIFLWLNMGTDSSTCNDINVALSLLVRVLVSFLPLTFTVLAIYGSDAFGDRFKRWTTPIIGIAILFVTARLVLTLVAFFINPRMCTIVAPITTRFGLTTSRPTAYRRSILATRFSTSRFPLSPLFCSYVRFG